MEKTIAEIMSEPAVIDEIIRKANELNDRMREIENMPELETNTDDNEPTE